jgi:N-acetylmuramoyl-L-alanine amidase
MNKLFKLGSTGIVVTDIQIALKLKADGTFGPQTQTAVIAFQKANKLTADGIVGPKTLSLLMSKSSFSVSATETSSKFVPVSNTPGIETETDPEVIGVLPDSPENVKLCPHEEELILLINGFRFTRSIDLIFMHCTATNQNATVASIQKYWKDNLKWKSPGYHILVKPDGSFAYLQDFNQPSNGVGGHNSRSIHISYIGGLGTNGRGLDNRTDDQKRIMARAVTELLKKIPKAKIAAHYDFTNKDCPSYNVPTWLRGLNVTESSIYKK